MDETKKKMVETAFGPMELIDAYTRKEALTDGVLIDATPVAKRLGYVVPVAFTSEAFARCSDANCPLGAPSPTLAKTLWLLRMAMGSKNPKDETSIRFTASVPDRRGRTERRVYLKAAFGRDDDGGPCLTVMLPHEDRR